MPVRTTASIKARREMQKRKFVSSCFRRTECAAACRLHRNTGWRTHVASIAGQENLACHISTTELDRQQCTMVVKGRSRKEGRSLSAVTRNNCASSVFTRQI